MDRIIVQTYDQFLPEDQISRFECDIEEGNYIHWVERYPEYLLSIFGSLLEFYGRFVSEEDILYFLNKGLNLNLMSNLFFTEAEFCSALHFACEYRLDRLISYLLKYGENVNQKDSNGFTPIEYVWMGHNISYTFNINETEKCVSLLLEHGAKNEIHAFIVQDYCEEYLEKSEYLRKVLFDSNKF
jgi:hypothetical protein